MTQESQKKQRRLGVLIGGSGLIGGTLAHYFKSKTPEEFDIRAPSSKNSLSETRRILFSICNG